MPAPLPTAIGRLKPASHRPPKTGKQEKNKHRPGEQAVGIVIQRLADRAVEETDQRPQAAAAWAPAEQVSIEADRRQPFDERRRHESQDGDSRSEQKRLNQVSPPYGYCFLRNGLPCASFKPSVAIRMTSISHQMPHPPAVSSFTTPSPM